MIDVTHTSGKPSKERKNGIKLHNTNKVCKPFMQKESQEKESFEHFFLNKKWYKRNREESEAFQLREGKKGWVKKKREKKKEAALVNGSISSINVDGNKKKRDGKRRLKNEYSCESTSAKLCVSFAVYVISKFN